MSWNILPKNVLQYFLTKLKGLMYTKTEVDNLIRNVTEGHTIWNRIKTALTKRTYLWFKDATVSDDSTNGATAVELVQTTTESAFNSLPTDGTADGLYELSDASMVPIDATGIAYGSGSVNSALNDLYGKIATTETTFSSTGTDGWIETAPYPTGFNKNNSAIISIRTYNTSSQITSASDSIGLFNSNIPTRFIPTFGDSGIDIYVSGYTGGSNYYGQKVEIVLLKFQ